MANNLPGFPSVNVGEESQWLADLLSQQQAMFGSFGAFGGTVPGGADTASPQAGGVQQMMAPWLEAAKSFTDWQQQSLLTVPRFHGSSALFVDQAASRTRRRNSSKLARPYVWRLSSLSLLI